MYSPERLRPVPTAVVGASAGGVEALRELVSQLPGSYEGALLVVLHVEPLGTSVLPPHAMDGALTVDEAANGARFITLPSATRAL